MNNNPDGINRKQVENHFNLLQFTMKFKFCSDGDCPLWALAALHALSSLPAPLFRTVLQHVLDDQPDDGIVYILKETSLSSRDECARATAVIRWVLEQCWRCSCPGALLTRDLLVLGVPRAHATALADAVDATQENHVANVLVNGFMVNKVTGASITSSPEGAINTIQLTLVTDNVFTREQSKTDLLIEKTQAKILLVELKKAYQKMEREDIK